MKAIMRSRIGYWTLFEADGGTYLNGRSETGAGVTARVHAGEVEALTGDQATAHETAAAILRDASRRVTPGLPTPRVDPDEPAAYQWSDKPRPVDARRAA